MGANGLDGANGSDGQDGADGVGIQLVKIDESGNLSVILTNGTSFDLGNVQGPQGEQGPQGVGVLVLGKGMLPRPLVLGGTGSQSESMLQPQQLPDRYESGTLNLPGIAGFYRGICFLEDFVKITPL